MVSFTVLDGLQVDCRVGALQWKQFLINPAKHHYKSLQCFSTRLIPIHQLLDFMMAAAGGSRRDEKWAWRFRWFQTLHILCGKRFCCRSQWFHLWDSYAPSQYWYDWYLATVDHSRSTRSRSWPRSCKKPSTSSFASWNHREDGSHNSTPAKSEWGGCAIQSKPYLPQWQQWLRLLRQQLRQGHQVVQLVQVWLRLGQQLRQRRRLHPMVFFPNQSPMASHDVTATGSLVRELLTKKSRPWAAQRLPQITN